MDQAGATERTSASLPPMRGPLPGRDGAAGAGAVAVDELACRAAEPGAGGGGKAGRGRLPAARRLLFLDTGRRVYKHEQAGDESDLFKDVDCDVGKDRLPVR